MLGYFCTWSRCEVLTLLIFLQATIILSLHGLTVGSGIQEQMQLMLLLVIEAEKAIGNDLQFTSYYRLLGILKVLCSWHTGGSRMAFSPLLANFISQWKGHLSQVQWCCINRTQYSIMENTNMLAVQLYCRDSTARVESGSG